MSEDPQADPLARLGAEIDRARRERLREEASGRAAPPQGALGLGFRIAVELVAALCVGSALGWLAYRFLPAPWGAIGLIVCFLLGSAAGMLSVFRAAKGVGGGSTQPAAGQRNRPRDS
jgi:F0F1-type ATP synthase assembly protein I